jgi:hypothetical protein
VQAFPYVFRSQPQTGAYSSVQPDGLGLQIDSASAAPQRPPSWYAQYSEGVHVLPAHAPQAFVEPASAQATSVHPHCPASVQEHLLQPSLAILISPALHSGTGQARAVHAHAPPLQTQVLHPSFLV